MFARLLRVVPCASAAIACGYGLYQPLGKIFACIEVGGRACFTPPGGNIVVGGAVWALLTIGWTGAALYQALRR
jgi:hypothetical protein